MITAATMPTTEHEMMMATSAPVLDVGSAGVLSVVVSPVPVVLSVSVVSSAPVVFSSAAVISIGIDMRGFIGFVTTDGAGVPVLVGIAGPIGTIGVIRKFAIRGTTDVTNRPFLAGCLTSLVPCSRNHSTGSQFVAAALAIRISGITGFGTGGFLRTANYDAAVVVVLVNLTVQ